MFDTVSACILWDWSFKSDHCPVVAEFLCTICTVGDKVDRPHQPPWRALLVDAADKKLNTIIRENVLDKIGPYKQSMETTHGYR